MSTTTKPAMRGTAIVTTAKPTVTARKSARPFVKPYPRTFPEVHTDGVDYPKVSIWHSTHAKAVEQSAKLGVTVCRFTSYALDYVMYCIRSGELVPDSAPTLDHSSESCPVPTVKGWTTAHATVFHNTKDRLEDAAKRSGMSLIQFKSAALEFAMFAAERGAVDLNQWVGMCGVPSGHKPPTNLSGPIEKA